MIGGIRRIRVNGFWREVAAPPETSLLAVLREHLRLTGAKRGCDIGVCGACTVLVDGAPRPACRLRLGDLGEATVTTIEGLAAPDGSLHPVQEGFVEAGAIQCGFCTPGMVLAAKALLDRTPDPTEVQIRAALAGHLCRCTGYRQIIEAVQWAARRLRGETAPSPPGH
jgi:aerobic-type carbon monoxide dehydrogenase small subunit (CoxS/CutS family)